MRRCVQVAVLAMFPAVALAADVLPDWAFLARTPGIQLPPEDNQPRHRPGSSKAYTQMQIDDRTVNLSPGMAVTVEIKTGSRTILSYLLSPLLRYRQETLRER